MILFFEGVANKTPCFMPCYQGAARNKRGRNRRTNRLPLQPNPQRSVAGAHKPFEASTCTVDKPGMTFGKLCMRRVASAASVTAPNFVALTPRRPRRSPPHQRVPGASSVQVSAFAPRRKRRLVPYANPPTASALLANGPSFSRLP